MPPARPTTVMKTVSFAPCSSAGMELPMTDQSKSMMNPAGARSGPRRFGAEPLLVDRDVAAVRLDLGERAVHLRDQRAALRKANAVLMRHHLRADGLDLALAGVG